MIRRLRIRRAQRLLARTQPLADQPRKVRDSLAWRIASWIADLSLLAVAADGALVSYVTLREAALKAGITEPYASVFPLMVDFLAFGATLKYVVLVHQGRFMPLYRWTAHGAVGLSVVYNALAGGRSGAIWHVAAPIALNILIELKAREALRQYDADHGQRENIPGTLMFRHPIIAFRLRVHMALHRVNRYRDGLVALGLNEAAVTSLRLTMPGARPTSHRSARKRLVWFVRLGVLTPIEALTAAGMVRKPGDEGTAPLGEVEPRDVLRSALTTVVERSAAPAPATAPARTARAPRSRPAGERSAPTAPPIPEQSAAPAAPTEPTESATAPDGDGMLDRAKAAKARARILFDVSRALEDPLAAPALLAALSAEGHHAGQSSVRKWVAAWSTEPIEQTEDYLTELGGRIEAQQLAEGARG